MLTQLICGVVKKRAFAKRILCMPFCHLDSYVVHFDDNSKLATLEWALFIDARCRMARVRLPITHVFKDRRVLSVIDTVLNFGFKANVV